MKSGGLVAIADGTRVPAAELAHVAPDLWPLVVPVDSLTPDPRNARLHGAQNLDAIARSLHDNGQLKGLSTDADGVVLAGDGTLAAAKSLGWPYIARMRCGLTGTADRRWAIQDNRRPGGCLPSGQHRHGAGAVNWYVRGGPGKW